MKIKTNKTLLFIEPKENPTEPIIDELTIKMFNLLNSNIENIGHTNSKGVFTEGLCTMGHHTCICGATSSGCDYLIDNKVSTNLLCVHYVARHRKECSEEDLKLIDSLTSSKILEDKDKKNFYKVLQ